jgi:TRAP-type C4-dicarboxylate transport system permease small subunit
MPSPVPRSKKVIFFFNRLEEILLDSFLILMVLLGLLQILFRNILSIGLYWIDPLMRHIVLWVALLGASAATREDRHISIDLLSGRLGPRSRSIVQAGIYCISAAICLTFVPSAVRFVASEYEVGKTLAFGIPIWISQSIIPVMLIVLGLRFLIKIWTVLKKREGVLPSEQVNTLKKTK